MNIRNILIASLVALSAGATMAQDAGDRQDNIQIRAKSTVTRAEVLAQLAIYRESGLADLNRPDAVDADSSTYRAATKRYELLRNSSRYAQLIRTYQAKTGEMSSTTKQPVITSE